MLKPVSRVIGIIRIKEASEFGVDLPLAIDDSTLGSLLAGLVGKQAGDRGQQHRARFECAAPSVARSSFRCAIRANLPQLHDELERAYVELSAR